MIEAEVEAARRLLERAAAGAAHAPPRPIDTTAAPQAKPRVPRGKEQAAVAALPAAAAGSSFQSCTGLRLPGAAAASPLARVLPRKEGANALGSRPANVLQALDANRWPVQA